MFSPTELSISSGILKEICILFVYMCVLRNFIARNTEICVGHNSDLHFSL